MLFTKSKFAVAAVFVVLASTSVSQATIINGDFELGNLDGWTAFMTPLGTTGGPPFPDVVQFDTTGSGASFAARFRVGRVPTTTTLQGGGIFQNFGTGAGTLNLNVDIAVRAVGSTGAAGVFHLLFDGSIVDSHDFAAIDTIAIERDVLSFSTNVSAGLNEIRILMQRAFIQNMFTPTQYIDNVRLSGTAVATIPEPSSLLIFSSGASWLSLARRQRVKAR